MHTKITIGRQSASKVIYSALFSAGMLFATSSAFAQVKIGTSPTVIGANSNLEVEAGNNKKVIVNKNDGSVVIQNTPVGVSSDKLLSVDAAGNVRTSPLQFSSLRFFTTGSPTLYPVNVPQGGAVKATLEPISAFTSSYDVGLKSFTVPETGIYTFTLGGEAYMLQGTGRTQFQIWSANLNQIIASDSRNLTNAFWTQIGTSGAVELTAGDKIFLIIHQLDFPNATISYRYIRLTAIKIY